LDNIKIIGIDFSLNSPAFCFLNGDESCWGSLYRTDKDIAKQISKPKSPFNIFGGDAHFKFGYLSRRKPEGTYYQCESIKLRSFEEITNQFFELFEKYLDPDTYVFMEGIIFGSPGNSLIDISMCTALIRMKIKNKIGHDKIYVFSPSSIKKYAIIGNAKKNQLYTALVEKHGENQELSPLVINLKQNIGDWIKKSGDVETPCSDIIDATWISLFGRNFIQETFFKQPV